MKADPNRITGQNTTGSVTKLLICEQKLEGRNMLAWRRGMDGNCVCLLVPLHFSSWRTFKPKLRGFSSFQVSCLGAWVRAFLGFVLVLNELFWNTNISMERLTLIHSEARKREPIFHWHFCASKWKKIDTWKCWHFGKQILPISSTSRMLANNVILKQKECRKTYKTKPERTI